MLGKLLKHDWKAAWRIPVLLIGILMITAVLAGLTFSLPIWDSEWIGLPLSGVMLILVFYFALIAVSLGIMIYFAVRYYKSMYTDEGYLTHTLPVSAREILMSKVITMTGWNLISGVAVVASMVVFGFVSFLALVPKDSSFARELVEMCTEIAKALPELQKEPYLSRISGFFASILCMTLANVFYSTMMVIGCINLGQMVRKHKILGAIGAYFAINVVMQFFTTILLMPIMMVRVERTLDDVYASARHEDLSLFSVMTPMYLVMALVFAAIALGLYFMSEYLLRRQLELE